MASSSSSLPPPSVPPWATLSSGAASGLASCLLLQPMDLLKTRMQQQISPESRLPFITSSSSHSSSSSQPVKRRGGPSKRTQRLFNTIKSVLRDDGIQGLWRGTVPTVARNVPGVALYFYSVSEIRAFLSQADIPYLAMTSPLNLKPSPLSSSPSSSSSSSTLARLTITGNLISGAVARVAVGFLLSPITVVKARFESSHFSKDSYPSLSRALIQIYTNEGIRGLFRGFSATAMRDAPYAGIYLASYEKCKHALGKWERAGERGSGNSVVVGVSGLFAGALATLVTHPFDIIKTRLQTSPTIADKMTRSASILVTAREIVRIDGAGAFLDGLGLRCARKAASSAIGWTIFEAGRRFWVTTEMQRRKRVQETAMSSNS